MPPESNGIFAKAQKNGQNHWWKWAMLGILTPALGVIGVRATNRVLSAWDTPVAFAAHLHEDNARDSTALARVCRIEGKLDSLTLWAKGGDPWAPPKPPRRGLR